MLELQVVVEYNIFRYAIGIDKCEGIFVKSWIEFMNQPVMVGAYHDQIAGVVVS